jgi:hypothetical protein
MNHNVERLDVKIFGEAAISTQENANVNSPIEEPRDTPTANPIDLSRNLGDSLCPGDRKTK